MDDVDGAYVDDFDDLFNDEDLFDDNGDTEEAIKETKDDNAAVLDDNEKEKILKSVWKKSEEELKAKSRVKRICPKLTEIELTSEKGLPVLKEMMDNYHFSVESDPYEKLDILLSKTEYWAHNLFPQMVFDDFLEKVEKLGHKRIVKNMMRRLRLGIDDDELIAEKDAIEIEEENELSVQVQDEDRKEDEEAENDNEFDNFLNSMRDKVEVDRFSMERMDKTISEAEEIPPSPPPPTTEHEADSEESDGPTPTPKAVKKRKIVIEDEDD